MNESELQNQIKSLEKEYRDLQNAMNSLANNLNNTAILRGTLSGAGAAAESILKCIIRREKINVKSKDPNIPIDKADELRKKEVQALMLDDMIKLVENIIPLRILTNLRTIQAWRNIGSHDKGEHSIDETVNQKSLNIVSTALSEVVIWFIGDYLNHDTSSFVTDASSGNTDTSSDLRISDRKPQANDFNHVSNNTKISGNQHQSTNDIKSTNVIEKQKRGLLKPVLLFGIILLIVCGAYFLFSSDQTPQYGDAPSSSSVNKSIELDKIESQILIGIESGEKKEVLLDLVSELNHDDFESFITGKKNGILNPSDPKGEYLGSFADFWSQKKEAYTEIITKNMSIDEYSLHAELDQRTKQLDDELFNAKLDAEQRAASVDEIAEIDSVFNQKKLMLEAEINEKLSKYSKEPDNTAPAAN